MSSHHDWILSAIETAGTPVLFVTLTLETIGLPLPGESALIAASAAAGAGKLPFWQVVTAAWAGAVLGGILSFLLGRRLGRSVVLGYGARVGITEPRYEAVERQFERYGIWVVMFARFVVLLRQLNGLVAGTVGMPWGRFLLANLVGATLWVGFWSLLAYNLGGEMHLLPDIAPYLRRVAEIVVPVLLIVLVLLYLRLRRRRAAGVSPSPNDPSGE